MISGKHQIMFKITLTLQNDEKLQQIHTGLFIQVGERQLQIKQII